MEQTSLLLTTVFLLLFRGLLAGKHERKLLDNLLKNMSEYERPAENDNEPLKVEFGLTLQQIIDVDEKNQIIQTNMWITMKWNDYKLRWNPVEYGNITVITIPSRLVWKPDILMYNSAADAFDSSYQSGIELTHQGMLKQIPPGMFKSTCKINIRWFPFDDQECELKFGSWTYDGTKIDLRLLDDKPEGSIDDFKTNGEWDLIEFPAKRNVKTYDCCPQNPFVDLTFTIHLRRRKLYYMVNIVAPCMLFAFLGLFTYTLPPDAGEKISFSVTVLLSMTVFMMIVSDTLPATSEAIPLIAVYFTCIMGMTAGSVISTITVLNMHHRSGETHYMPSAVKYGICEWLAWILMMKRPGHHLSPATKMKHRKDKSDMNMLTVQRSQSVLSRGDEERFISAYTKSKHLAVPNVRVSSPNLQDIDLSSSHAIGFESHPLLKQATASSNQNGGISSSSGGPSLARLELRAIHKELRFLTDHIRETEVADKECSDWKWCAMVLDRLFVWIFTLLNIAAVIYVLVSAPHLFDFVR